MAAAENRQVVPETTRRRNAPAVLQTTAVALTVLLALAGTSSSAGAMDDDLAPETAPIQPGAPVCTPWVPWHDHPCGTLGFVLRDLHDNLYITTAAHGYNSAINPDMRAYTADNQPFPYRTTNGFGTVVIDDDTDSHMGGAGTGSDVALIAIDRDKYHLVKPSVRYWTGPTGVLKAGDSETEDVIFNYTLKNDPAAQAGRLINHNGNNFNTTLQLRELEGDGASGSPYVHARTGRALGLNANCLCGTGTFGYATLDYVLRRFSEVYGKDLTLLLGHYKPPAPTEVF